MILSQQLSTVGTQNANKPAIHYLGKETNYTELKTRVARLSYLYMKEIGHEARVAFLTRNSPAVLMTFFAMTNTRNITIPMDPDLAPEILAEWLKDSKATHIAVTSDLVPKARELLQAFHLSLPIIEIEKKQGGEYDTSFSPPSDNAPLETDAVILFRTAGTCGKSKFVSLNHKQLHHAAISVKSAYHFTPADRIFTTMNWSHPFSFLHGMLLPVLGGGTCVIDHGAEAAEFLEFVTKARVSRMVDRPPNLLRSLLFAKNEKYFPPTVKSVVVGLGFLSADLRKIFGLFKINVVHTYGQTEAGWNLAMEDTAEPGAPSGKFVGRGLTGLKYKVMDAQGDEVAGKEERQGMLAVTGPSIMSGYYELEKETKQAIRGTWLYTGDYVKLDGDGDTLRITFLGRKEDVVLADQDILTADAIDHALKGAKGVQDAAGFPVKTAKEKIVLACAVVKAPGSALNEKQIVAHCGGLPSDQAPLLCVFTDAIPRDAGGNVMRAKLKAQFSGMSIASD
jgi:acyl-CoA synthetase (AMP-forming)/AMP-acid ligase II